MTRVRCGWRSGRSLGILGLISLAACTGVPTASPPPSASAPPVVSAASGGALPTAQVVPTQPFAPTPIRITVADLPAPAPAESVNNGATVVPIPAAPVLEVPPGFQVNVFAEGLNAPRWLALTPEGDVLVTETPDHRIRRLADTNGDGVADQNTVFAERRHGLNRPLGMVFTADAFFVGNTDEVRRYAYQPGQGQLTDAGERIASLPSGGHWTRNLLLAPDGQSLLVAIGSRSNVSVEPLPRASIQHITLDGDPIQTWAAGLRNPVGLAWHPFTQALYTTVNERDGLGDELVPDYLTQVAPGSFYGWPYTYLRPDLVDPRRVGDRANFPAEVAQTQTPDVLFQAHSAALGLTFYTGSTFPERYHHGALVALRGSWNRSVGTGYKLVFVPFDAAGQPLGYYEDWVRGFLTDPQGPTTWGRPVAVLTLPDGSVLFTEEANGRIYRVQYSGAPSPD